MTMLKLDHPTQISPFTNLLAASDSTSIRENQPTPPPTTDTLIAYGWERVVYGGAFLLFVGVIILIGHISSNLEHALLLALVLSIIFIGFMITL